MSHTGHVGSLTNGRRPPQFFEQVRTRAQARWNQLEADPELAGPWRQLFSQVQSPRHVVSELLQNADDAGATRASVQIQDGYFVFEHDGEDFTEEQFASLCRFGFSNKRKLHTIGFRGIGFKSTFSIGDTVEVWTPTLAVKFGRSRFTEPCWVDTAPTTPATVIRVRIRDANAEREVRKNLDEWANSPTSLLFFNSIKELTLAGRQVRKDLLGRGPVQDSERILLTGFENHPLILFRSPEACFPEEAIAEIRQERSTEDLHLPPCRVEIVLGLPGRQRLFVVLPTGVSVNLPFSCNAPFLQDPARTAIRDPAVSATNRWLLQRLGELAATVLLDWLGDASASLSARAEAYWLLPQRSEETDSIEADCSALVQEGCRAILDGKPLLLATDGTVVGAATCLSPPSEIYTVWSSEQIAAVFGSRPDHKVLAEEVSGNSRQALESWGWLARLSRERVIERLSSGQRPPRPVDWDALLRLWAFMTNSIQYDYGGQRRRKVMVLPVEGQTALFRADEVVRLGVKKEIDSADWPFLAERILILDRDWLAWGTNIEDERRRGLFLETLKAVGLDSTSPVSKIVEQACRDLFSGDGIRIADCIRMAQLLAVLGTSVPTGFRYVTRDNQLRGIDEGIVLDPDGEVEELLPPAWREAHVLHAGYYTESLACAPQQWLEWARSDKSGLLPLPQIRRCCKGVLGRRALKKLADERQATQPTYFPYVTENFRLYDYDFDDEVVKYWSDAADAQQLWCRVITRILNGPAAFWKDCVHATLGQIATTGHEKSVSCDPIPAEWIIRLRPLACLPDTHGHIRVPAELFLRTPDTEPLMGVEPFVQAELDNETSRPLLKLLGVRDAPSSIDKRGSIDLCGN